MSSTLVRTLAALGLLSLAALAAFSLFQDGDEPAPRPTSGGPAAQRPAGEAETLPPEPESGETAAELAVAGSEQQREAAEEPPVVTVEKGEGGISGVVVDASGNGIAGARVTLCIGPKSIALGLPLERKKTDRQLTTKEDGTFHFAGIPAGDRYVVQVEHPDYARAERSGIVVREGDITLVPDIVLDHGARVLGTVTARGGAPIAGARVELWNSLESNMLPPEQRKPWAVTETQADGSYEFRNVHFNALEVVVSAEGYATASRSSTVIFAKAQDRRLDFELSPATSLSGLVVDPEGRPIAGATIEAYQTMQGVDKGMSKGRAQSDVGGRFVVEGLAEGTYNLSVRKRGYSDTNLAGARTGSDVKVTMQPRGSVAGRVVDQRTGAPVGAFEIEVLRSFGDRPPAPTGKRRAFRSADGRFVVDDLDPGRYALEAVAEGYAPGRSAEFDVERGREAGPVEIRLGQGAAVHGLVVDSSGQPIPGATVKLNPNGYVPNPILAIFEAFPNSPKPRTYSARTGTDGSFRIERVAPGVYQVEASHPAYTRRAVNDVRLAADADTDAGRIVLSSGGTIVGTCVSSSGEPFADGTVHLQGVEGSETEGTFRELRPGYDGRFEIPNLPPGEYELSVQPDKLAGQPVNPLMKIFYAQETQTRVRVREGSVSQVKLTLPPPKRG